MLSQARFNAKNSMRLIHEEDKNLDFFSINANLKESYELRIFFIFHDVDYKGKK
jgi:hypothetical protein